MEGNGQGKTWHRSQAGILLRRMHRDVVRVIVEDVGMGVVERVGYKRRRQDQREWVVESREDSQGLRPRRFRQDVYVDFLTGKVAFGDEVVESVAR